MDAHIPIQKVRPDPPTHTRVRGSPVLGLRATTLEEARRPNPWIGHPGTDGQAVPPPAAARPTAVLVNGGLTHAQLARDRRAHRRPHIARGWYAERPLGDEETLLAAVSILPRDVVIAGETAAMLQGVDQRPTFRHGEPFRLCVVRERGRRATRRPGVRSRVMELFDGEIIEDPRGFRMTSAVRTACDLAMGSTIDRATAWIEGFRRAGLVTTEELLAAAAQRSGRRGVRILRRAIQLADPRSESPQETAVRLRLLDVGLPVPDLQVEVALGPGARVASPTLRIDLGWRQGDAAASSAASVAAMHEVAKGDERDIDDATEDPVASMRAVARTSPLGESKSPDTAGTPSSQGSRTTPEKRGGVGVEYYGAEFHPDDGPGAVHDTDRIADLKDRGWDILVLREDDLAGRDRAFECEVGRRLGVAVAPGPRLTWKQTRTNAVHNAWTRSTEPWWQGWRPPGGR